MKRYIEEFFKLRCASDLLALQVFPNAKEITESMGCFSAVRENLLDDTIRFDNPNITVYVVGDSTKPRTGALFALRTAWTVISIDPMLVQKEYNVKRLFLVNKKIEDYEDGLDNVNPIIIVLPHSHARLPIVMGKLKTTSVRHIVSLPCCVPHEIGDKKYIGYRNPGIWSEKNTIKVWKNI
jgi:hypothetical protein